jgi:hypothetical protein
MTFRMVGQTAGGHRELSEPAGQGCLRVPVERRRFARRRASVPSPARWEPAARGTSWQLSSTNQESQHGTCSRRDCHGAQWMMLHVLSNMTANSLKRATAPTKVCLRGLLRGSYTFFRARDHRIGDITQLIAGSPVRAPAFRRSFCRILAIMMTISQGHDVDPFVNWGLERVTLNSTNRTNYYSGILTQGGFGAERLEHFPRLT